MPLKNIAQLRALKAKERRGEISSEKVREFIDATPRTKSGKLDIPRGPVRKGWRQSVATGLATGTLGGIVANQLPQTSGRLLKIRATTGTTARVNTPSAVSEADKRRDRDKRRKVAKADRRKPGTLRPARSEVHNAAIGAGSVVGGVGLVGGGVPGVKANRLLLDVKRASGVRRVPVAARAYRAGEFGYRHNAHKTFLDFGDIKNKPAGKTKTDLFHSAYAAGKAGPERTIVGHLRRGRLASNALLAGGTGLALWGANQKRLDRRRNSESGVLKRMSDDDYATMAGAGAGTAASGYGLARVLENQGRKWSAASARSLDEAGRLIPGLGDRTVRGRRVPDVRPVRSPRSVDENVLRTHSRKTVVDAAMHRGAARQQRYFAGTYGGAAGIARRVAVPAGLVALGVGAGVPVARRLAERRQVSKADAYSRVRDYPYLQPIPDNGYIRLVRMPVNPSKMKASTRLLDRAVTEAERMRRGKLVRQRGEVSPSLRYTQGRQFLFAPTGSGTVVGLP